MTLASVLTITITSFLVGACAPPKKDYQASARCLDLGIKPGSAAFDECVSNEKAARLLSEQRESFEQMRQDERDWKMRRF
jgi:hypothetical protein